MPATPQNRRNHGTLRGVGGHGHRRPVDAGGIRLRLPAPAGMGPGSAPTAPPAGVSDQATQKLTRGTASRVGDLARIYEGPQEPPAGPSLLPAPRPRQPGPDRPGPAATGSAAAIAGADMRTILAALDEAADYKRDRTECCADCADQSCGTCQHRLRTAHAYETLAVRIVRAIDASPPRK